jgi:hypothetical protein
MTSTPATKKLFSIRMANLMLPLVSSITADVVELNQEVKQTRERLDYLYDGRSTGDSNDEYGKELSSIEKHTNEQSERISNCIEELEQLNLGTSNALDGFVDFPAERMNEPVCLCWRLGDSEVKYWHAVEEDCSQRQPVDLELIRQSGDLRFSESV